MQAPMQEAQEKKPSMKKQLEQTKEVITKNNDKLVRSSFFITYAFLITTGTITFIEALRTKDYRIRNILNLETCISVVAAYFYGRFVSDIDEKGVRYDKINVTRYTDWAITTPIMLLVLCLALLYNTKGGALPFFSFIWILFLNYGMLSCGYLGETNRLDKRWANVFGFLFFIVMYGFIYMRLVLPKYNSDNQLLFWTFVILWAMYGVIYELGHRVRNIGYNVLDLFSKCFVGIFFWAYFSRVFRID
jgi:bacteriorhodopsin|tara:strand:- start:276 stop:1016 length:741 start_codon:yes stop_codon:yes gene_type:complete